MQDVPQAGDPRAADDGTIVPEAQSFHVCKVEHVGAPRLRAVAAGEWAKPISTKVTYGRVVKPLFD